STQPLEKTKVPHAVFASARASPRPEGTEPRTHRRRRGHEAAQSQVGLSAYWPADRVSFRRRDRMDGCPDTRSGGHGRRWARVLPRRPAAPTAQADRRTNGREGQRIMSGKFCAECLEKDVHGAPLHKLTDCWDEWRLHRYYRRDCV